MEEPKLRLLTLDQVETGDTYEFACAHIYDNDDVQSWMFWSPEYRYLEDEAWGIGVLAPYLDQVFPYPNFSWYGPTKVTRTEWERVERLCLTDHPDTVEFFQALRAWMAKENRDAYYFWILGP